MKQSPIPPQQGPYILWHDNLKTNATAAVPMPPNSVTVIGTPAQEDLAAKPDQAGFHEQMTFKPAPLA